MHRMKAGDMNWVSSFAPLLSFPLRAELSCILYISLSCGLEAFGKGRDASRSAGHMKSSPETGLNNNNSKHTRKYQFPNLPFPLSLSLSLTHTQTPTETVSLCISNSLSLSLCLYLSLSIPIY